jgi:3-methyladenine DNA glycosylase AlkD
MTLTAQIESQMLQTLLGAANMNKVTNNLRWQSYINTSLITIGLDTPTQRSIAKTGHSGLNNLPLEQQIVLLGEIFRTSEIFEIKNQCLLFLDQRKKKGLTENHWPFLKEWVKYVDNWAHSDGLSSVFSMLLQHHLDILYPQLIKWNTSKNIWERRQSVVCLFYFSSTRKKFLSFDKSIILIKHLLTDQEYYVQKGIGWALREACKVYYDFTYDFIVQHIKEIKPAAYSAAIEKLRPEHREIVKLLRKKKSTF